MRDHEPGNYVFHSDPAGISVEQAPLTETPPTGSHAPEGGNDPSPRLGTVRCWGHIKRVADWLDDSVFGDLIGVLSLFGSAYLFWVLIWAFF